MNLIRTSSVKVDLSGVELQLKRIADALELAMGINQPQVTPDDFDPDEFSYVFYTNEEEELIKEKLGKRVAGIDMGL